MVGNINALWWKLQKLFWLGVSMHRESDVDKFNLKWMSDHVHS